MASILSKNDEKPPKNNRGSIEIRASILDSARSPINKTAIMYKSNLSFNQVNEYLSSLMNKNLITQERDGETSMTMYKSTDRGKEFLACYDRMWKLVNGEDGYMGDTDVCYQTAM